MIGGRMIVVPAIQCKFIDFMNLINSLWFDDTQLLYWGLISSESVCSNFTQANKATRHLKEAIPLDRWTMLRPWLSKFWLAETPWIHGKSYQPSLEITWISHHLPRVLKHFTNGQALLVYIHQDLTVSCVTNNPKNSTEKLRAEEFRNEKSPRPWGAHGTIAPLFGNAKAVGAPTGTGSWRCVCWMGGEKLDVASWSCWIFAKMCHPDPNPPEKRKWQITPLDRDSP